MINIAILGYGIVGSGVAELIDKNRKIFEKKINNEIKVKYILDIRDFPGDKYESLHVKDFNIILTDPEVSIVVETIGGTRVAYEFTKKSLLAGKNVVTSNKELVACHAPELLEIARDNNVNYLFEASVGGGIPIIAPLYSCLGANEIKKITGILNGTSNYILTKMIKEGMPFDAALKNAQALGYAEANPTADIDGHDTCRKICILASLAFGRHIYPNQVYTLGIQNLTADDLKRADEKGCEIKLLGSATRIENGDIEIFVSPCAIKKDHPLANIEDVFNGITVTGDAIGDVTFYGRGAGKFPTASAVGADIIECSKNQPRKNIFWLESKENFVVSFNSLSFKYLEGTKIPFIEYI